MKKNTEEEKVNDNDKSLIFKVSKFIVEKRALFFFIFFIISIFSLFSIDKTIVQNDLTSYLADDSKTRSGLDVMNREFTTFSVADVMINNVTYEQAEELAEEIRAIENVQSVNLDDSIYNYNDSSALLNITFDGIDTDEYVKEAMIHIREHLQDYDTSIDTLVGLNISDILAQEMSVIVVVVFVIIVLVLLLTSKSYFEVVILLITFGIAALINMGTNFLVGEISFISNSVAVILQLALAIDYAIILIHRFAEEKLTHEFKEAAIYALRKGIVEISSSSLTTICGLLALSFMSFKIGLDLSIVLIKSIIISLLTVFILMPGLLVVANFNLYWG